MRQIKFRGYFSTGGIPYYGDLIHRHGRTYLTQGDNGIIEVDPDRISQLVGYDRFGNEVYEGDVLITRTGFEYMARMYPSHLSEHTLKEATL